MTNRHDGPRAGSQVTVIQAATPTRLPEAEAEELDRLITAAIKARGEFGVVAGTHSIGSAKYVAAQKAADETYGALYRWQLNHGLGSK